MQTKLQTIKQYEAFFFCMLFTLANTAIVFSKLDLKSDIILNTQNNTYILANRLEISSLFKLINKPAIHQLAKNLVEQLLKGKNIRTKDQLTYVKYYLTKFKYYYRRYFIMKAGNTKNLLTDEELNFFAFKSLLLLLGL